MEMPLARAAKRGWTFIFVPMTLEFPPQEPSDSMYCRRRGPAGEADPASARPNPSKIVFLPSAITFSGMSSYFVFTINSETYLVRPGALANSSAGSGKASTRSPRSAKPASAKVVLQKSRRIIGEHLMESSRRRGIKLRSAFSVRPHDCGEPREYHDAATYRP